MRFLYSQHTRKFLLQSQHQEPMKSVLRRDTIQHDYSLYAKKGSKNHTMFENNKILSGKNNHCVSLYKNLPLCDHLIIFSDFYGVNPTIGCFIGSSHLVSPLKVIFYP